MTRLVVGECIVDLHPETGEAGEADGTGRRGEGAETSEASEMDDAASYVRRPGGAPANVAVGMARLGDAPALWTRLGADGFGDFLAERLASAGIPDTFVERDDEVPTGLAVVGRDDEGERSFSLYLEGTAAVRLDADRVDDETLEGLEWLHVGGVELAHEPARSVVFDLLDRAPDHVTVSFDPNARPSLWRTADYGDTLARALPNVDVLVASAEDLLAAGYDGTAVELASTVVAGDPHTALITRGAAGAYARSTADAPWGAYRAEHPGFDTDVVDTTGAGDAFTAGALTALDAGNDLASTLRFATAVGAWATTARGATAALPTRAQVETFLANR